MGSAVIFFPWQKADKNISARSKRLLALEASAAQRATQLAHADGAKDRILACLGAIGR